MGIFRGINEYWIQLGRAKRRNIRFLASVSLLIIMMLVFSILVRVNVDFTVYISCDRVSFRNVEPPPGIWFDNLVGMRKTEVIVHNFDSIQVKGSSTANEFVIFGENSHNAAYFNGPHLRIAKLDIGKNDQIVVNSPSVTFPYLGIEIHGNDKVHEIAYQEGVKVDFESCSSSRPSPLFLNAIAQRSNSIDRKIRIYGNNRRIQFEIPFDVNETISELNFEVSEIMMENLGHDRNYMPLYLSTIKNGGKLIIHSHAPKEVEIRSGDFLMINPDAYLTVEKMDISGDRIELRFR